MKLWSSRRAWSEKTKLRPPLAWRGEKLMNKLSCCSRWKKSQSSCCLLQSGNVVSIFIHWSWLYTRIWSLNICSPTTSGKKGRTFYQVKIKSWYFQAVQAPDVVHRIEVIGIWMVGNSLINSQKSTSAIRLCLFWGFQDVKVHFLISSRKFARFPLGWCHHCDSLTRVHILSALKGSGMPLSTNLQCPHQPDLLLLERRCCRQHPLACA